MSVGTVVHPQWPTCLISSHCYSRYSGGLLYQTRTDQSVRERWWLTRGRSTLGVSSRHTVADVACWVRWTCDVQTAGSCAQGRLHRMSDDERRSHTTPDSNNHLHSPNTPDDDAIIRIRLHPRCQSTTTTWLRAKISWDAVVSIVTLFEYGQQSHHC